MGVVVITPPDPLITLELAKSHLNVDHGDHDTLITAYIAAACAHIDGPAGWLGRAIGAQTLELRSRAFCSSPVTLPYPPITSITSVKYLDAEGVEQTADTGLYTLLSDGRLALGYGQSWPGTRNTEEAVRVRYAAGYATIPDPIISAVLLMVGDMYSRREVASETPVHLSPTVEALLSPYRVWSL